MGDATALLSQANIGAWAIVFKANGLANLHAIGIDIAITIGHGEYGVDLAGQADCFVIATGIRVLQRNVLHHAEMAVLPQGHSKSRLTIVVATVHTTDQQACLKVQGNGVACGGLQPRIHAIAADDLQAEFTHCAFVIGAVKGAPIQYDREHAHSVTRRA